MDSQTRFQIDSNGIQINDEIRETDGETPTIDELHQQFEGTEGLEATLKCAAKGAPAPLVTWLDPHQRNLSSVGGYIVDRNSGALIIARVRKTEDSGQFTCVAENSAGSERKTTNFVVLRKPKINSFLNQSFDENKESLLECRATGDPIPDISIRRDGDSRALALGDPRVSLLAQQQPNDETVLSLRLSQTRRSDDGLYFCRAHNRGGVVETAGHLEVRFAPDMSRTPITSGNPRHSSDHVTYLSFLSVKTWNQQPINMTCVADAIPNATIRWWFRGQDLALQTNLYQIEPN
ncbi:unnamed protein product, partial [Medioppia subpectinata]